MVRIKQRGHSLIESLFAIMFVGAAASIAFVAMPASSASKSKAKYMNFAVNFATRQIEEIQYHQFARITADDLSGDGLLDSAKAVAGTDTFSCSATKFGANDTIASKLPGGSATVRIENVDADTKRITVHVQWKERSATRNYDLGTVVTNL